MLVANALLNVALAIQVAAQAAQEPLPAPTGPLSTGRLTFHWVDSARQELETSANDDKRELMVHLFYPAEPGRGARAPYVPDAEAMRGPWSEEQIARIKALRAYSRENAAPAKGGENQRFPVVLLSAGGGMKVLTYHTLLEDLASHGYVVAAIEGPYNPRAVQFPDGRVLGNLAPAARGWPAPRNGEENQRYYQERVVHMARDMSFVIDKLTALDRGNGPFARRLDLARGVGAVGHSRGGQVAGAVRVIEPRVCGGINIDGIAGPNAILPIKENDAGKQPFLWIQTLPPPPNAQQLERAGRSMTQYNEEVNRVIAAWDTQMKTVSGGAIRVLFDGQGIEHIDFSDEPYWDHARTADERAGKVKTIAMTRAYVRAFFEGCLKGDWGSLKKLVGEAGKSSPDVTVTVSRKIWPE